MAAIPPQSEIMKKCCYLDQYNDIVLSNDSKHAASTLVLSTIEFARICFFDSIKSRQLSSKVMNKFRRHWPTNGGFSIFDAFPKIDAFMRDKYFWLEDFSHSSRLLNEIKISNISYFIFEICYGSARVSYPVVQATFSIYFIFEVNRFADPSSECVVKYFLEGWDEEMTPFLNDKINLPLVKSIMKKKLALSSLLLLNSDAKEPPNFNRKFAKFIEQKKNMLNQIKFERQFSENMFDPCEFYDRIRQRCSLHGPACPVVNKNLNRKKEFARFAYEEFKQNVKGEEKFPELTSSSENSDEGSGFLIKKVSLVSHKSEDQESKKHSFGSNVIETTSRQESLVSAISVGK